MQELTQYLSGTGFDLTATFAYNPAGQIASKTVSNDAAYTFVPSPLNSTTPAQFDGRNQLTSFAGTAITDDANGNVWTGLGSLAYTYDALGQLRQASGTLVDYDPAGMLRRVQAGGTVKEYLYDGADLIAEYNGTGTVLRRFVHGAGADEPLVLYEGSGTANKSWLHADERGSIVAASNGSGVTASSGKYSVDGSSGALASSFGYTGQLYLPDLQLYYYKARMYSPKAGRFLQPDPIGYADGMNMYSYVGNDPISRTDASGLCWELVPELVFGTSVLEDGQKSAPTSVTIWVMKCLWGSNDAGAPGSGSDSAPASGSAAAVGNCWNGEEGAAVDFFDGMGRQVGNDAYGLGLTINPFAPLHLMLFGDEFFARNNTNKGILGADLAFIPEALIGGAAGLGFSGTALKGSNSARTSFSHMWPDRWGGPRSIFNGRVVPNWQHSLHDSRYFLKGTTAADKFNPALKAFDRTPPILRGALGGLALGLTNGC